MDQSAKSLARLQQENANLRKQIRDLKNQISSTKQPTQEQIEGEKDFYKILANASMGAIYVFQDNTFQYVNNAFIRMSGYTPAEITHLNYLDLIHPDYRDFVQTTTEQALTGDTEDLPREPEIKIIRKDGEHRWVWFLPTLIRYQGKPAILANAVDVTSQKAVEKLLKEQRRQYREAIESIDQAVCILDKTHTILFINSAGADLLGQGTSKVLKTGIIEFLAPDHQEAVTKHLSTLEQGNPVTFAHPVISGQAAGEAIRFALRPMLDADGHYLGAFASMNRSQPNLTKQAEATPLATPAGLGAAHTSQAATLLTMCASCKRVKDTGGQWELPEAYFSKHLRVGFSHSICPECMKTLYPDFFKSDE